MPKISVGVRVRPDATNQPKLDQLSISSDNSTIELSVSNTLHSFTFDQIFPDYTTQNEVFKMSTTRLVENALEGYNGCIFAYGQTGAGKTHTISGSFDGNQAEYGICAQAAFHLFQKARQSIDNISIRLSILEIYNESLIDLLVDLPSQNGVMNAKAKLNIIETDNGVLVPGLHIMPVDTVDDALTLLMEAQANRAVAEHQLNHASSRSHIIYSYYITRTSNSQSAATIAKQTKNKIPAPNPNGSEDNPSVVEDPIVHQSKLHIVDLAGSERMNKTGSVGTVQKEANYINRSLSFLEQVVIALSQSNRDHIPYRQSKLTYLLKDSLGGNSNTYLIACIWPRRDHAWETLSTLRFAARMKSIETHPIRNRLVSKESNVASNGMIKSLQGNIELLKKELALRDFIHNYDNWLPELNKQQLLLSYKQCFEFLQQPPVSSNIQPSLPQSNGTAENEENGTSINPAYYNIQPIEVHSLSQIQLLFHFMKDMIYELADPATLSEGETAGMNSDPQENILSAAERVINKRYGPTSASHLKLNKKLVGLLRKNQSVPPQQQQQQQQQQLPSQQGRQQSMPQQQQQQWEEQTLMENHALPQLVQPPQLKESADTFATPKKSTTTTDPVDNKEKEKEKDNVDLQLNNEYFQDFTQKTTAGKDLHSAYEELKETLKTNKKRQKQIITMLNDQKYILDEITIEMNQYCQILTDKQQEFSHEHEQPHDDKEREELKEEIEEIERIIQNKREKMESVKKQYRTIHQELLLCKEQIQETQSLKKRAMNALLMAFNDYMKQIPVLQSP